MLTLLRDVRDKLDQIGAEPDPVYDQPKKMWDRRPNEPEYAKLHDPEVKPTNVYGQKIDTVELTECKIPANESLFINANPAIGENPNRYKQHGFHFTADNCIGCHACEAACSEKNGNPAHISFRSVGYVEGGTYPDYKRMNISMACNHCDDPVCLKGCPTRAYTKHLEYGAVLQDPDTCFGCGYCTWVCPYNAPQLDPIEGQVSKCNMCVDRLEEGLKPACVSACLGNALDFGVVENTPKNREQILTKLPGFPDPEITHPNIRFQQIKNMPNEVTRTDTMPIKYHKDKEGSFRSVVDEKVGKEKQWNLDRLNSRENPLVIFTLATQGAIGAFLAYFWMPILGISLSEANNTAVMSPLTHFLFLGALVGLQVLGLVLSTVHLGKPLRFYRGFNNLRHSPLSREALGVAMFLAGLCAYTFFFALGKIWPLAIIAGLQYAAGLFATASGLIGLYYMTKIYRIRARPFWNHWQVSTTFFGSMLSIGGLLLGSILFVAGLIWNSVPASVMTPVILISTIGFIAEAVGLFAHARYLDVEEGEGAAAHYIQCTTFGWSYICRNILLGFAIVAGLLSIVLPSLQWVIFLPMLLAGVGAALIGRALFYVLVIPTTMPGAFFWKNKGFEQHARDIGLANMPQVGVVPDAH